MTYPPSQFGTQCGRSWGRKLTVTGEIDRFWGSQFKTSLSAIVTQSPPWGRNHVLEQSAESKLRALIASQFEAIADLRGQDIITPEHALALRWLLDTAEAALDAVAPIYDRWDNFACVQGQAGRTVCPWPLSSPADHVQYWMSQCANPAPGTIYEDKYGRAFTCPPPSITEDRRADRSKIKGLFLTALRHVRCCQYWTARAALLDRARRLRPDTDPMGTFGPGGQGPRPPEPGPAPAGDGLGSPYTPEPPLFPKPDSATRPEGTGRVQYKPPTGGAVPLPLPDPAELPPFDPDAASADEGDDGPTLGRRRFPWGWVAAGAALVTLAAIAR